MQESLINQGVELMIFGMGTVFVFLILLVFSTMLLSFLVNALGLADAEVDSLPNTQPATDHHRLVAVVTAALTLHRKRRK